MTQRHHMPETVLAEYAAGISPEPVSLIVASHATLCENCRRTVDMLDQVGGAMLESLPGPTDDEIGVDDGTVTDVIPSEMLKRMYAENAEPVCVSATSHDDFLDVCLLYTSPSPRDRG